MALTNFVASAIISAIVLCLPSWGAITITQHVNALNAASATTVTISPASTASGAFLVIGTLNNSARTVSSITDNKGNTYIPSGGGTCAANDGANNHASDVWSTSTIAISGVTSITVTFSGAAGTFNKEGEVWEVAGFIRPVSDICAPLNNGVGVGFDYTGAVVTTTSTIGFIAGAWVGGATVTQNPKTGNEFTSGGDINGTTGDAFCSLISTTAASHTPVWHGSNATPAFAATTAAYRDSSIRRISSQ